MLIRRSILSVVGLGIIAASLFFMNSGTSRTVRIPARPPSSRILMVGDSLTVGTFGEILQEFLISEYGVSNVAVYGSCGSSPEHWLRSEPEFVTKCGYREQTSKHSILLDFANGRPPPKVTTPKLEDIVAAQRPTIVIVQLGTNWMDRLTQGIDGKKSEYDSILDRFIRALRSRPGIASRIVWITPPDSSHFSKKTQRIVEDLIKNAAQRDSFDTIISSRLTRYIPGKTGGDGVHYDKEAGTQWALSVTRELMSKLR